MSFFLYDTITALGCDWGLEMELIADLHIHSKYSRAVSKNMSLSEIAFWAAKKGIGLVTTGDWMHTFWFREIQNQLEEVEEGVYKLKVKPIRQAQGLNEKFKVPAGQVAQSEVKFLLSTEISSIYTQGGRQHRVHTLVFAPNISIGERINAELLKRGCNLASDGRPIVGLSPRDVAEIALSVSNRCLVIPAHAWTPHFSVFGSRGGFDSLAECFGNLSNFIFAVETGLSSDPFMNWRIAELERRSIVSFSDAHSGPKLGREATVFREKNGMTNDKLPTFAQAPADRQMTNFKYNDIYWAMAERFLGRNEGNLKIASTIEFYPEEGKYHYDGHRDCGVVQSPEVTRKHGKICHVCGRPLTVGVMYRVDQLSGSQLKIQEAAIKMDTFKVANRFHPTDETRPPYVMLVPLLEILSEVYHSGVSSNTIINEYNSLISAFRSEFAVLLRVALSDLQRTKGERLAQAIEKVRKGEITISPGYDGVFGKVAIWGEELEKTDKQMTLF